MKRAHYIGVQAFAGVLEVSCGFLIVLGSGGDHEGIAIASRLVSLLGILALAIAFFAPPLSSWKNDQELVAVRHHTSLSFALISVHFFLLALVEAMCTHWIDTLIVYAGIALAGMMISRTHPLVDVRSTSS